MSDNQANLDANTKAQDAAEVASTEPVSETTADDGGDAETGDAESED